MNPRTSKWTNPHRQWFEGLMARHADDVGYRMSQNQLAAILKIGDSGLSRRLDGETEFRPKELERIAGMFDRDLGAITEWATMLRSAWEAHRESRR